MKGTNMLIRFICAALLTAGSVGSAAAQSKPTTPTKTGYLIPGCTDYVIDVRTDKMIKICDPRQTKNAKQFWKDQDRTAVIGN